MVTPTKKRDHLKKRPQLL